MTALTDAENRPRPDAAEIRDARLFLFVLCALTLMRIAALLATPLELGPDETQYWFWSREPTFGYYSKPPLIAWSIAATTAIFGDAEWAVRLSAPLYHAGAAIFLFLLARRLYSSNAAFWTGVIWLTYPGVFLSSTLIATDAPLLFFWSAALYAFCRLVDDDAGIGVGVGVAAGAALGLAVGLGFLAKYAMVYFALGVVGATLIDRRARRAIVGVRGAAALAVAAVIAAPNIIWNARNDFRTLAHTADNADWAGDLFQPVQLIEFLVGQLGVIGPLTAIVVALAVARAWRTERDRRLIAFILPPLIIVSIQAFISRAHANWAAAAYPAATVLIAGLIVEGVRPRLLQAGVALNALAGAAFFAALAAPRVLDVAGAGAILEPLRGWKDHAADIARAYGEGEFDAVMADDREILGGLLYYARGLDNGAARFVAWDSNARINDHYEAFIPHDLVRDQRTLYVTTRSDALGVRAWFDSVEPIGVSTAALGGARTRTLYLFDLSKRRATTITGE